MHRLLLAAAAAFSIATVPAFAQTADCPPGTTPNTSGDTVTCDADDNTNDVTGTIDDTSQAPTDRPKGDSPLDTTQAGEGVKDAVTNPDGDGGGGNNNNN